jgi:hypothetical protein
MYHLFILIATYAPSFILFHEKVRRGYWRGMEVAIKTITAATTPNSNNAAASEAAAADLRREAAILARVRFGEKEPADFS